MIEATDDLHDEPVIEGNDLTVKLSRRIRDWENESGQVIVLVTAAMMSLIAMMGLVFDIGVQLEQRRQLQNAVDAAAHAGAQMLPVTTDASARATALFNANLPSSGTPTFTVDFPTPDLEQIEIIGTLEVDYAFLALFGKSSATVTARAVAGAQPTDVVITLDRSGSMCRDSHWLTANCPAPPPDHEPMTSVKDAAIGFQDLFDPGWARMGLASFSTTASLDQVVSTDFGPGSALETAVNGVYPSGYTNIGDAISVAHTEVTTGPNVRVGSFKVIVLLSDGDPNRCAGGSSCSDSAAATHSRNAATAAALDGVTIFTIGLGANVDGVLMQEIADIGGGEYILSPSAAELEATFDAIAALIKVKILQ